MAGHLSGARGTLVARTLLAIDTWQPRALAALAGMTVLAFAQDAFIICLVTFPPLLVYAATDIALLASCAAVLSSGALTRSCSTLARSDGSGAESDALALGSGPDAASAMLLPIQLERSDNVGDSPHARCAPPL
jgi:hypothetical protein